MALSSTFVADFSEFTGECAKAEVSLTRLGNAHQVAAPKVSGMGGELRKVDGILAQMGVNISSEIKAIEEIGQTSGKTASQVGVLGSAVAVAGAAWAGWQIGRKIAELTGADEAVSKLTASILGYNVAAETMGAQQDTINLAFSLGADYAISYEDAIKFVNNAQAVAAAQTVDWASKLASAKEQIAALSQEEIDQIAVAKQLGASSEQLKLQFGLSDEALKIFNSEVRTSSEVLENNASHLDKLQQQLDSARARREAHTAAAKADSAATVEATAATVAFTDASVALSAALEAQERSLHEVAAAAAAAKAANDAFMNAPTLNDRENPSTSFDITPLNGYALDDLISQYHQAGDTSSAQSLQRAYEYLLSREGRYDPSNNAEFFQMQREQILLQQLRMMLGGRPHFKEGVENFSGGLAYVHKDEMLVNMPSGTSVIPAGRGGTTININLSGIVGDKFGVARLLKKSMRDGARAQGQPIGLGAEA